MYNVNFPLWAIIFWLNLEDWPECIECSSGRSGSEKPMKRGHANLMLRFAMSERVRDEENEAIVQLRIFRVQVYTLKIYVFL